MVIVKKGEGCLGDNVKRGTRKSSAKEVNKPVKGKSTKINTNTKVKANNASVGMKQYAEVKLKLPAITDKEAAKILDVPEKEIVSVRKAWEIEYDTQKEQVDIFLENKADIFEAMNIKIVKKMMEQLDVTDPKFRDLSQALKIINDAARAERGQVTGDVEGFMAMIDSLSSGRLRKADAPIMEAEIVE